MECKVELKKVCCFVILTVIFCFCCSLGAGWAQELDSEEVEVAEIQRLEPDGILHLEDLTTPPRRPADLAELQAMFKAADRRLWVPDSGKAPEAPHAGTETRVSTVAPRTSTAPKAYVVRDTVRSSLGSSPGFSDVTEMSGANDGKYVFATGNWWAARSTNAGSTWTFYDPYSGFSSFCCDQDVVFDAVNDMFVWYRQGVFSGGAGGTNQIQVGASTDDSATWCIYTLTSPAGEWFDFPHLALTERYLYFTTNMFDSDDDYLRSRIYRFPLSGMKTCSSITISSVSNSTGTITPAQGGTSILYAGQHVDTATLRIFKWQDGSSSVSSVTRSIPAWTAGAMSCPGPDGRDMCARADHRITGAYVGRHTLPENSATEVVSFFWNAKNNSSFPKPYVDNAWFKTADLSYGGRQYIWDSSNVWMYAHAFPNRRGEVGVVVSNNKTTVHPRACLSKDDYKDSSVPGWGMTCPSAAAGTQGPPDDIWGDYNRVRCFEPRCTCWMATSHMRKSDGAHPVFSVFGHADDQGSCYTDWFNQP